MVPISRACHVSQLSPFGFSAEVCVHTLKSFQRAGRIPVYHLSSCQNKLSSQRKPEEGKVFQKEKLIKFTDNIRLLQIFTHWDKGGNRSEITFQRQPHVQKSKFLFCLLLNNS